MNNSYSQVRYKGICNWFSFFPTVVFEFQLENSYERESEIIGRPP